MPSTCPPLHLCTLSLNVLPSCPLLSHPQTGSIPGALNLPISAIRNKLEEVPKGKKLFVHCAVSAWTIIITRCAHMSWAAVLSLLISSGGAQGQEAVRALRGECVKIGMTRCAHMSCAAMLSSVIMRLGGQG